MASKLRILYFSLFVAATFFGFFSPQSDAQAAPISPQIVTAVVPAQLVPAQGGYVTVSGGYPMDVAITLDDEPLRVFWSGQSYMALLAFGFDEPPGTHTLAVSAFDPLTGERLSRTDTLTVMPYTFPLEQIALPFRLIPLLDRQLNENEVARLEAIYTQRSQLSTWDWPFASPVPGGIVTSRFGGDRIYNGGIWAQYHTGMDYRRSVGEPVYATAGGRVVIAEPFDVRGTIVIIDHGHGLFSQYAHLSEYFVQPGDFVTQGQLIALAGATGRTNGPHLHFEIIINSITVDPLRWMALDPSFVPPREVIATRDGDS